MKHNRSIFALIVAAACSAVATEPGAKTPSPAITALPRTLTAGETKLISATNDFSWSLFGRLSAAQKDSNVFTSPLSASMALGMAMNGAAGTTYTQMRSALAYGSATDDEINASYKTLITLLKGLDSTSTELRIANSLWYDKQFVPKQTFLDITRSAFNAQAFVLDFRSAASVGTINAWVAEATAGNIPKIIDQIKSDDVMFLINAIYFKGQWRQKFDAAETADAVFHGVAGDQPMRLMHRKASVNAAFTSAYIAADLPYGDSTFTMTVVVPQGTNTVEGVAASLNGPAWTTLLGQMHGLTTDVYLPKLKLEWERKLNADLIALGMRDAFSDGIADFSRLTAAAVVISEVKQKTYVDINEEGTTAAAVTSVGITVTSLPPQVRVDRPFLFVIRERLTGTMLFMGKIVRLP